MSVSVREKADMVATWRWTAVFLMETLARWVPTSPELEAKALFGRHIWDLAQIADQLGRRTAELRLGLHHDRDPVSSYRALLERVAATGATAERLAAFYDAALPDFARRIERFNATADPILDDPTTRILERALLDVRRMCVQREALLEERPELAGHDGDAIRRLRDKLADVADYVDYRPAPAAELV
jgi:hypothetical protein